jgi:hypothetical protein
MFMGSRELVKDALPDMSIPRLARTSTPDEWAQMGWTMLDNKHYAQVRLISGVCI